MQELTLMSGLEAGLLFLIWSKIAARHGWSHESLISDNAHLRICYQLRKWVSPSMFAVFSAVVLYNMSHIVLDAIEIFSLNILVLVVSQLIGLMISESLVHRFRVGRTFSKPSAR